MEKILPILKEQAGSEFAILRNLFPVHAANQTSQGPPGVLAFAYSSETTLHSPNRANIFLPNKLPGEALTPLSAAGQDEGTSEVSQDF